MTSLIGSVSWKVLAGLSPVLGNVTEGDISMGNIWSGNLWTIVGWTMFHYLWIGLLLLVIAAAGRRLLRRAMPQVRYAYGLAWLSILVLLPLLVGGWLAGTPMSDNRLADVAAVDIADLAGTGPTTIAATGDTADQTIELHVDPAAAPLSVAFAQESPAVMSGEQQALTSTSTALEQIGQICDAVAAYLPWLWLIGTPLTFALLATGLVGAERLGRQSQRLAEGEAGGHIVTLCRDLAASLRIGRRVAIRVCDRIGTPILVGVVRPMILLPPSALTGWSPQQLEMVLLHELVHVRRWDNLVNLLQRLIESVLFFQPAVWIVGGWIRTDREHCCDAAVVRHTQRPSEYAQTLAALAVARNTPNAAAVMAAGPLSGGAVSAMAEHQLIRRIRHILNREAEPMQVSRKTMAGISLAMLLVIAGAISLPSSMVQAEPEPDKSVVQATPEKETEEGDAAETVVELNKPPQPDGHTIGGDVHFDTAETWADDENDTTAESAKATVKNDLATAAFIPSGSPTEVREILRMLNQRAQQKLQTMNLANQKSPETFSKEEISEAQQEVAKTKHALIEHVMRQATQRRESDTADLDLREAKLNYELAKARLDNLTMLNKTGGATPFRVQEAKLALEMAEIAVERAERRAAAARAVKIPHTSGDNAGPASRNASKATAIQRDPQQPAAASKVNKSSLRYDGKSFGEWRVQWRTELNPERRAEAVKAFAMFAKNGYGREAAEEIMTVMKQYNSFVYGSGSPEDKLKQAALGAFHSIDSEFRLPIQSEALESDNDNAKIFAGNVASRSGPGTEPLIPVFLKLAQDVDSSPQVRATAVGALAGHRNDPKVKSILRALVGDEDVGVANAAIIGLVPSARYSGGGGGFGGFGSGGGFGGFGGGGFGGFRSNESYTPELASALGHQGAGVRSSAAGAIGALGPKAKEAVPALMAALTVEKDTSAQRSMIAALGRIGPAASEAVPALEKLRDETSDDDPADNKLPGSSLLRDHINAVLKQIKPADVAGRR